VNYSHLKPKKVLRNELPNSQSVAKRSYTNSKGLKSRSPYGMEERKNNKYINVSLSSPTKLKDSGRGLLAQSKLKSKEEKNE